MLAPRAICQASASSYQGSWKHAITIRSTAYAAKISHSMIWDCFFVFMFSSMIRSLSFHGSSFRHQIEIFISLWTPPKKPIIIYRQKPSIIQSSCVKASFQKRFRSDFLIIIPRLNLLLSKLFLLPSKLHPSLQR